MFEVSTKAPLPYAEEAVARVAKEIPRTPRSGEIAIGPNERARSQYPQSCGTPQLYDEK